MSMDPERLAKVRESIDGGWHGPAHQAGETARLALLEAERLRGELAGRDQNIAAYKRRISSLRGERDLACGKLEAIAETMVGQARNVGGSNMRSVVMWAANIRDIIHDRLTEAPEGEQP